MIRMKALIDFFLQIANYNQSISAIVRNQFLKYFTTAGRLQFVTVQSHKSTFYPI